MRMKTYPLFCCFFFLQYICIHAPHVFSLLFFFFLVGLKDITSQWDLSKVLSLARLHTTTPPMRHSRASLCQQSGSATCERCVDERNPAKTKGTRQALEHIIHIWQCRIHMISLLPKQMGLLKLIFNQINVLKMIYAFFIPLCFCHEDIKRHSHCHAINLLFSSNYPDPVSQLVISSQGLQPYFAIWPVIPSHPNPWLIKAQALYNRTAGKNCSRPHRAPLQKECLL